MLTLDLTGKAKTWNKAIASGKVDVNCGKESISDREPIRSLNFSILWLNMELGKEGRMCSASEDYLGGILFLSFHLP